MEQKVETAMSQTISEECLARTLQYFLSMGCGQRSSNCTGALEARHGLYHRAPLGTTFWHKLHGSLAGNSEQF